MQNIYNKERPELFFGLVGATGTKLKDVITTFEISLKNVGYKTKVITLSEILKEKKYGAKKKWNNQYLRIKTLQSDGDKFRTKYKNGGAVARLGIGAIRKYRRQENATIKKLRNKKKQHANITIPRQAYFIKSLKHKTEVDVLRNIYGENFWLVSAYTPRGIRKDNLIERIKPDIIEDESKAAQYAEELIERDFHNAKNEYGQDVRKTFPEGDVFIDVSAVHFKDQVNRFVELIFGNTFWTPSIEEYGMFHAHASALRSSSLSKQVGTSIISTNGDLISTGINEVPKSGGGHYIEGDDNDQREFQLGEDSNHIKRNEMLRDVFAHLQASNWLSDKYIEKETDKLVLQALKSKKLEKIKFLNVTEFGREVHAEMSALMDASRRIISVKNGTLYCTTFPCHVCAKHIIAAGIKKVVFIEPYPKSIAQELFKDSISVEHGSSNGKVEFNAFVGISPKRYMDLFEMGERKADDGKKIDWEYAKALPRYIENKAYGDQEADELKLL